MSKLLVPVGRRQAEGGIAKPLQAKITNMLSDSSSMRILAPDMEVFEGVTVSVEVFSEEPATFD